VVDILGVNKVVEPFDNKVPAAAEVYQSIVVPETAVADNETVPAPHLELLIGAEGA
jgi:hypothetical protein